MLVALVVLIVVMVWYKELRGREKGAQSGKQIWRSATRWDNYSDCCLPDAYVTLYSRKSLRLFVSLWGSILC